ncbi:hypothetical protein BGZ96_007643 [Linnemannia gamsii]|uniref:Homeobox domain-containing protein n=1 Tax=Linnemannia gamsii TaxID=64522 RepID=A0ABQ7KIQ1_9FUNG|nr:hypothetical protein BGZ96_007643 [Linnemannia gamsii]
MSTVDINETLSKVTPQKTAFLVDAWLVHQAIPDVSTLKFIAAIIDLDFEIVRYWFYCRSNQDGIKRAFAQSAAGGSDDGIVLPLLEEYYLLDKFSDDIDWDYRGPDFESQEDEQGQMLEQEQELEHEQESACSSPTTAPQPTRCKQSSPKQQRRRSSSITTLPSDLIKTLKFDTRKKPPSNTENRRRKPTRRRNKAMESSDEGEQDYERADDSEECDTLGTRSRAYARESLGPSKPSRPRKAVVRGSNGEPIRKRGRPPGVANKKAKLQSTSTKGQPPAAPTTQTKLQQLSAALVSIPDHPQTTDSSQISGTPRYLTPVILLPARAVSPRTLSSAGSTTDAILQDTTSIIPPSDDKPIDDFLEARDLANGDTGGIPLAEKAASSSNGPTSGLVGDPVAGAESRKRFLELHQSEEAHKRREQNRARSTAPSKTRGSKGSSIASSNAKPVSKKRKVVSMSGDDDRNVDDDEDEDTKGEDGNSTMAQDPPSSLRSVGDFRKVERAKGPTMGNPPAFFKEYGALIAKRREKQPGQEQPPESTTNLEIAQHPPTLGAVPQLYQTPIVIAMAPIDRTVQHPLPPNLTAPTLHAQAHVGEPKLLHHPHNKSPSYFSQYSGSKYDTRDSSVGYVDHQAFEQEKIASRQRDYERRKEESERQRDYNDDHWYKEHKGSSNYRTDAGRSDGDENRDSSRGRSRERNRSGSRKKYHRRKRSESSEPLRRRSVPRGRSVNPRPLNFRQQTIYAATIVSKNSTHRNDDLPSSTATHADKILSPQLHTQHRFSYEGSHSPFSPEAFDPASLASAPFPPLETLPQVTSSPHQPQHAQSGGHYPLEDRRHSSRANDTGTPWNTHHEHQCVSQVTSPVLASDPMDIANVPTAPASYFSSGSGNGYESCNNDNSTDAHGRPRESSSIEFYSPQPINMELTHSSLPPPARFSPSRHSDQPPHFSTFAIPHPDTKSKDQPQSDTTQHLDSWAARPEALNWTKGGRSIAMATTEVTMTDETRMVITDNYISGLEAKTLIMDMTMWGMQ